MPVDALAAAPPPRRSVRRIEPATGFFRFDLRETWRFRELLVYLIWRDVKARYKQTALGAAWALLRPFLTMIIFTVIFGQLAGIESGTNLPYPLFVFGGLLIWLYFSSAVLGGSASIVGNTSIVTKAYFPRVYVPVAAAVAPIVDLVLSFAVLAGMFAWYGRVPPWHIVALPLFIFLVLALGTGVSLWLAALTVRFRDVPYALPFAIQTLMYLTPVIYPVTFVPDRWRWLLYLNPLTPAIEGFRWALVGGVPPTGAALAIGVGETLAMLVVGLGYFGRRERRFADII